jgi:L-lactate dehydrogenase complex protein LldG
VSDRQTVLAGVRAALGGASARPEVVRRYRRQGGLDRAQRLARFCERVQEYRAEVRVVTAHGIAESVDEACAARSARRIVVPDGLPAHWRPAAAEVVVDRGLTPHELDEVDGVVTGATVAIAETGTLVLTAAPHEGRRAITLVPDLHVCVIEAEQIVELVPEAIAAIEPLVRDARRPVTFVSGPSATSDIELSRVEGVHGPRTLVVLVVEAAQDAIRALCSPVVKGDSS